MISTPCHVPTVTRCLNGCMHPLARRRATGYLRDCAGYLGIAAAMVPLGLVINAVTDLGQSRTYVHAASVVPPAIATLVAARAESGPRRATWGKRRVGLQVEDVSTGGPIPFGRALARNSLKILIPWQAGHVTTIAAIRGGFEEGDPIAYGASFLVYGMMAVYAVTCLRGSGRGPHDLAAGDVVVDVSAAATAPRSR